ADERISYEADWYAPQVQAFLEAQGSVLAGSTVSVGRGSDSFAHALTAHCLRYGLNPKVVLALLEVESGLVTGRSADADALRWAFGLREEEWAGLERQLQWATYLLAEGFKGAGRSEVPLLTDGAVAPIPSDANLATRALLRVLAHTADSERFAILASDGPGSFVAAYRALFGEDPRLPPSTAGEVRLEPFLFYPLPQQAPLSACFDHEAPVFQKNGSVLLYTGSYAQQPYDGHDGWDYAAAAGTAVLAAAPGRVVWAGWLDTFCPTPAGLVVLDHGNGYRTLYWHLQTVEVAEGQHVARGDRLGTVGSTGCSSGPHLHLTVQYRGRDTDPFGWCGSEGVPEDPWALDPAGTPSRWLWADRPPPCGETAKGTVRVDDRDATFGRSQTIWYEVPAGQGGHAFWTVAVGPQEERTHRAVWRPEIAVGSRYFLYAYIPWYDTGRPDTVAARYFVRHAEGEAEVVVDQAHAAGMWAFLGVFPFGAGSDGYVYLDDGTPDPGTTVWFDAIVWVPDE
ncbi:MAG: peptidoglycan DD-metalloendopeptidase family protein, partial [Chloroflexia bacterium]